METRRFEIPILKPPDNQSPEVSEEKINLIKLLQENSERIVIATEGDFLGIITNCHEELFRKNPIKIIGENSRPNFVTNIGESLFHIFLNDDLVRELKSALSSEDNLHITLNFKDALSNEYFDLLQLPWEYLRCPQKIDPKQLGFRFSETTVLTRTIGKEKDHIAPVLNSLNVLIIISEDFQMEDDGRAKSIMDCFEEAIDNVQSNKNTSRKINFSLLNLNTKNYASYKNFKRLLSSSSPNIIHYIGDTPLVGDKGHLNFLKENSNELEQIPFALGNDSLVGKVRSATEKHEADALFLFIVQSINDHSYNRTRAMHNVATFLSQIGVSSVCNIPHGSNLRFPVFKECLQILYSNLIEGTTVGNSTMMLRKHLLDNDYFGLPVLYLNNNDFSLFNQPPEDYQETGSPRPRDQRHSRGLTGQIGDEIHPHMTDRKSKIIDGLSQQPGEIPPKTDKEYRAEFIKILINKYWYLKSKILKREDFGDKQDLLEVIEDLRHHGISEKDIENQAKKSSKPVDQRSSK